MTRKLSVIDMFAGAGGLSYGFIQSGRFDVKAAFEINERAKVTYAKNHPDTIVYGDIMDADYQLISSEFGELDAIIGGPPCQGFSNANRQKNSAISLNNALVKEFVRAVECLRPKSYVMENVAMLRSATHRFFISESDRKSVIQKAREDHIILLEAGYVFNGIEDIILDRSAVSAYIWPKADYQCLNVIYKLKNNIPKLSQALVRHEKKLSALAEKLLRDTRQNHIALINRCTGRAILSGGALNIVKAIEHAIMIQRMLSKAQELTDNKIKVSGFTYNKNGLVAKVKSMSVIEYIDMILSSDYKMKCGVLKAVEFGAPQKRERYVIIGIRKDLSIEPSLPAGTFTHETYRTVRDAISDIEDIEVKFSASEDSGITLPNPPADISELGHELRDAPVLYSHITPHPAEETIRRFRALKQGENFHDLDASLKRNYSDTSRTQNTIYLRLNYSEPSGTVVNIRKSMWIHPEKDRAVSAREAARLQTFPDSFIFDGPIDSQYQQIGNAVPPLLAKEIALHLAKLLDGTC